METKTILQVDDIDAEMKRQRIERFNKAYDAYLKSHPIYNKPNGFSNFTNVKDFVFGYVELHCNQHITILENKILEIMDECNKTASSFDADCKRKLAENNLYWVKRVESREFVNKGLTVALGITAIVAVLAKLGVI